MVLYSLDQLQLWTLDDSKLKNKANIWQSNYKWKFTQNDDGKMIYINNINNETVLTMTDFYGIQVKERPFDKRELGQLWIKGTPNSEGYFTLQNFKLVPKKFLTAILIRKNQNWPVHDMALLGNSWRISIIR